MREYAYFDCDMAEKVGILGAVIHYVIDEKINETIEESIIWYDKNKEYMPSELNISNFGAEISLAFLNVKCRFASSRQIKNSLNELVEKGYLNKSSHSRYYMPNKKFTDEQKIKLKIKD